MTVSIFSVFLFGVLCVGQPVEVTALSEASSLEIAQAKPEIDAAGNEESQGAGLKLATRHLAELIPVLDHLKSNSPAQYEKAVRDLDRAAKRLDMIRKKDAKLFDISLREWKTRGQIDLLKAKLRVKPSDGDKSAMLQRMVSLRKTEIQRIDRELELIEQRQLASQERIQQSELSIRRGQDLRKQLLEQKDALRSDSIDETSPGYQRAIGNQTTNVSRPTSSSMSKSTKASE